MAVCHSGANNIVNKAICPQRPSLHLYVFKTFMIKKFTCGRGHAQACTFEFEAKLNTPVRKVRVNLRPCAELPRAGARGARRPDRELESHACRGEVSCSIIGELRFKLHVLRRNSAAACFYK